MAGCRMGSTGCSPNGSFFGYIPDGVWIGTRGYIEAVCKQLNGCFHAGFYDAAAVMLRRLLETLIIETYEQLKREAEIKDEWRNLSPVCRAVSSNALCGDKGARSA